ncbi:hypothetical protein OG226_01270 [Streptomyces sp. NBC_01261]|uniref:hypothetical protein n=1 Tax=Streptomyces sp. NBC_01261 TaxID=2903802 RepID=UPI002E37A31B|nr:hypothetical protein [Streptomyces sp. NBC_01261]
MQFPVNVEDHPVVRQAVQRLDGLGDPRFGRTLVRCLDDTVPVAPHHRIVGVADDLTPNHPLIW